MLSSRHFPGPGPVTVKSRSIVAALAGVAKVPARIMLMALAEITLLSDVFILRLLFNTGVMMRFKAAALMCSLLGRQILV